VRLERERKEEERRQAEAAEAARIRAEQQASEKATVSPLGVGASAPPKPVVRPQPKRTETPPVERNTRPAVDETPTRSVPELPAADAAPAVAAAEVQRQSASAVNVREETTDDPVSDEPEMVSASQLNRTTYVGPEYPRNARRRNQTGSVDLTFTVGTDGSVHDVTVLRSEPAELFDQSAIDAVEQWRFEPVIENGVAVEKRTAVRLAFDLN